ncbi:immunity protein Imm33 domain-containing protein [Cerasicoccus arenae]|uniref:Imm33-like domain-containing protein n=1 Tax=Cerasicoccus arenae TaxID=424488 RepID=A0A8J3GCL2_9BACT|nr:hypothetical protein [Cerasicoccus arenae]MBK1856756.1 hypothetical protein [Cerasicoccus arenae]GHB99300.1 hypothetical protein GCM10007047_14390 [Cerasicoccus arenae]
MNRPTFLAPNAIAPAQELLDSFLDAQLKQGVPFEPGQFIQLAWMWLKVGGSQEAPVIMAPIIGIAPMTFAPDCSDALNLIFLQRYVCDSFQAGFQICDARQSIIVMKDIENCKELHMARAPNESPHASGWFLGAADSALDAEKPDSLELKSLWDVACLFPQILDFFLLPDGWQVVFKDRPIVLHDYEPANAVPESYFARKYLA